MKKILFLPILLFPFIQILSQKASENDSIYILAVEKYTNEIDSIHLKYSLELENEFDTLFFERPFYIDKMPEFINGHKIILVNSDEKDFLFQKKGKNLLYTIIYPIFESGLLKIAIVPYRFNFDKSGEYLLELSDWTYVYFSYDCSLKKWEYLKTEVGGI